MTLIKIMFGMRVHKTVIQLSHKHISNHCESKHVRPICFIAIYNKKQRPL